MTAIVKKMDTQEVINREIERDPSVKSVHSKAAYKRDLAQFNNWRAGRRVTKTLVEEYLSYLLVEGFKPQSINRKLTAIRWWVRRMADLAYEDDTLTREEKQEVIAMAERVSSVRGVRGESKDSRPGRHLSLGEVEALIHHCQSDNSPLGVRDAAIFAILRATGIRRAELLGLTLSDIQDTSEKDEITYEITVFGKGDKSRVLPINNGAALHLRDWLTLRGDDPGAIFCRIRKGGHLYVDQHITPDGLQKMKKKRVKDSSIQDFVFHDWRRTFAGDLWEMGVDGSTIADLMGHTVINQTRMYDRRGDEAKRRAVRGLFVPYKPRRE